MKRAKYYSSVNAILSTFESRQKMQNLKYSSLEKIDVSSPADRLAFISEKVKNKIVLDLGALDETAYEQKENTSFWLHKRICEVAKRVYGVDNSSLIPEEGLKPFPNSIIYKEDVYRLEKTVSKIKQIDIVVAGELIEHLTDTLSFLKSIKNIQSLQGKELILTTPNATSLHNAIVGTLKREATHVDHLCIYSYKTLNTLCKRAGFCSWEIIPYHMAFPEMISSSHGFKKYSTILFEKLVNFGEKVCPLLCGGWIVHIKKI